jgi:tetratricopeptide (TPR) repeat protein
MDLAELLQQRAYQRPSVSPAEQRRLLLQSEANFRKALQFGEIEAATRLGEVLLEKGDIVGAREAFTAGMELRKPRAAFKLGELAIQEQDHELAQRAFERCVELADEAADEGMVVEASYQLGRLFETIGRHAAAERSYRRALGSAGGVGFPPAAMRLAEIVQADGGDPVSAKDEIGALYRRGIELGSAEAALKLGQLEAQDS